MRTVYDRIRHSILFELIGLIIVTPLGGFAFDQPMHDFGVVALVSTSIAMFWNYAFNYGFDLMLMRKFGITTKTFKLRVFHAVAFEAGLLSLLVPFISWYLDVAIWIAFMMDVSLAGFYLVYAFIFNWGYDLVYPAPMANR